MPTECILNCNISGCFRKMSFGNVYNCKNQRIPSYTLSISNCLMGTDSMHISGSSHGHVCKGVVLSARTTEVTYMAQARCAKSTAENRLEQVN